MNKNFIIFFKFDDQSHMRDVDPEFSQKCDQDLKRLGCFEKKSFDDVVECLRVDYDNLSRFLFFEKFEFYY